MKQNLQNSEYFRPFPDYEDVFYDDIENHKKHFLPICSVNLKFMFPERDEWVHFISAKARSVGTRTLEYHTPHSKEGMYSFDIIDGKYKFEADWNYFYINHQEEIEKHYQIIEKFEKKVPKFKDYWQSYCWIKEQDYPKSLKSDLNHVYDYIVKNWNNDLKRLKNSYSNAVERLHQEYQEAELYYDLGKAFFNKHGHILERFYGRNITDLQQVEKIRLAEKEKYPSSSHKFPEYFGFIEDIKFQSKKAKVIIDEHIREGISLDSMRTAICYNIWELPFEGRKTFEYLGCISEYNFKPYGYTVLNVFHDSEYNKATVMLDND